MSTKIDSPYIDGAASAIGLGMLGTYAGGKGLSSYFGNPDVDFKPFNEGLDKLRNLKNLNHQDFAVGYVDAASNLAKSNIDAHGKTFDIGSFVLDSKERLANTLTKNMPKIDFIHRHMPGEDLKKGFSQFRREGINHFIDKATNAAEHAASMEHYDNFRLSPGTGWKQLMAELPEIPLVDFRKILKPGQLDLVSMFSEALSKAPEERNNYINNLKQLGTAGKNGTDFNSFFKDLSKHLGYGEDAAVPVDKARAKLMETFFQPGKHAESIGGHSSGVIWDYLRQKTQSTDPKVIKSALEHITPSELTDISTDHISRFNNLLARARMFGAPKSYGRMASMVKGLKATRNPLVGIAGLGLTGLGLNGLFNKEASANDSDLSPSAQALLGLGGTGAGMYGIGRAINQIDTLGWRKHNPFSKTKGVVLGGTDKGPYGGSFTFQRDAIHDALTGNGIDTTKRITFMQPEHEIVNGIRRLNGAYVAKENPFSAKELKNADFVIQSGASGQDAELGRLMKDKTINRYRVLSDFNQGSLKQPERWLAGRNWMKVHDGLKDYTRFIVPGNKDGMLDEAGKIIKGVKDNKYIDITPVSSLFKSTPFSKIKDPRLVVSMGGGAGSFIPFTDIADAAGEFDVNKRSILTDAAEAFLAKNKGKGAIDVMIGNTMEYDTPASRYFKKLMELSKDKNSIYSKMNFIDRVPQTDLARKVYARASNIMQLPGSTISELMSMPGNNIPNIVNMLPDTKNLAWMPNHWKDNADIINKAFGGSNIDVNDVDRLEKLKNAFSKTVTRSRGPLNFDMSNVAKTIKTDAVLSKLRNLGKLSGKVGLGAAGIGAAGYALQDVVKSILSEDRKDVVGNMKQKLIDSMK